MTDPVTKKPTRRRKENKGRQPTSRLTINGRIKLQRRWWHASQDGSECPADSLLGAAGPTPGVVEMACRENEHASSFAAAAENLWRTAQIKMSDEQLRDLVEQAGKQVLAAQQAGQLPPAFQAEDCRTPQGQTQLYLGCDGVMVPVISEQEKQKRREKTLEKRRRSGKKRRPLPSRRPGAKHAWQEFKTVTFYNHDQSHRHLLLSRLTRPKVQRLVRREGERIGFARAEERLALVDGASWLKEMLQDVQPVLQWDEWGLDFYHLSENVHKTRRSVFGDENADGHAWADDLMHTFKHQGYETAWEKLCTWRATLKSPKKKQAADRLLRYVTERAEMINYPKFLARGWDIGSGPTESRCKVATRRLKAHGQRWDPANAEAIAALTCLHHSGQWNIHWKTLAAAST